MQSQEFPKRAKLTIVTITGEEKLTDFREDRCELHSIREHNSLVVDFIQLFGILPSPAATLPHSRVPFPLLVGFLHPALSLVVFFSDLQVWSSFMFLLDICFIPFALCAHTILILSFPLFLLLFIPRPFFLLHHFVHPPQLCTSSRIFLLHCY